MLEKLTGKLKEYTDLSVKTLIVIAVVVAAILAVMIVGGVNPADTIGFND